MMFAACLKKYVILLLSGLFIPMCLFGQHHAQNGMVSERLEEIARKIDDRNYDEAKLLLKEIEGDISKWRIEDRFALDLSKVKIRYYVDYDEESIALLLTNLEKLRTMNTPRLYYEYTTFIGQVFKNTKNFKKAVVYYKQALLDAEKRNDTLAVIFSCLKIGSCFYRVEYSDMPEYDENHVDSAWFYYNKALQFPENSKNNSLFSRIYDNLSRIAVSTGTIDVAETYARKALKINSANDNSFSIAISLSNLSTIYYLKKEYKEAIKSAQESNLFLKGKSLSIKRDNLEYIARSYEKLNDHKSAYRYLYEAHTLSEILAKKTLDKEVNTIEARYNVVKEKQYALAEKNKRLKIQLLLYTTLFLVIVLLIFGVLLYKRNSRYKKRFKELMKEQRVTETATKTGAERTLQLSPEMIKNILERLENFERKQEFLTKNLTLYKVAKKLHTNSRYLSKVVNAYKKKNFAAYINELRVHHAIQELKVNKQLRSYTIEAIAHRMGYRSAEAFSVAFRKTTGLYPSYFIKQLQKQSNS